MFKNKLNIFIVQTHEGFEAREAEMIRRESLVESVARELRVHLAAGKIKDKLPGGRVLSQTLGVCVSTRTGFWTKRRSVTWNFLGRSRPSGTKAKA